MKIMLIVEDDSFLQELESNKFKKEGYEVVISGNGKDAIGQLEGSTKFDIILLDLMLPDVDGFEILKNIRANDKFKNTPVIVFSNLSEEADIDKAKKMGATDFMVKSNFTLDELTEKVNKLVK